MKKTKDPRNLTTSKQKPKRKCRNSSNSRTSRIMMNTTVKITTNKATTTVTTKKDAEAARGEATLPKEI